MNADNSPQQQLIGYFVVWNVPSDRRPDGFRHVYARGSIRWAEVVNALWASSYISPLGSTRNGTLKIVEDSYGARALIDLDDTSDGRNAMIRVGRGSVRGMDFSGARLSYKETGTRGLINIAAFVADTISVTLTSTMPAAFVATAQDFPKIWSKQQQGRLDRMKLATLRPAAGR